MVPMTRLQKMALSTKFHEHRETHFYTDFRESVRRTYNCNGAVLVRWCGGWLIIDRDGNCKHE